MVKDKTEDEEDFEEDLEQEDELADDETVDEEKETLFPFNKMPFQEKGESENDIHEYDMGSDQELNLGESEERTKRRNLRDERGAGHEP
jgi:hypothetical protein